MGRSQGSRGGSARSYAPVGRYLSGSLRALQPGSGLNFRLLLLTNGPGIPIIERKQAVNTAWIADALGRGSMIELDGENYLDGEEASRLLGVKTATLYAYVSRGLLKSYKQGIKRQRLYRQAELEALLRLRPSDTPAGVPAPLAQEPVRKKLTEIPLAEDWVPYT